jgi:hypothetical protein
MRLHTLSMALASAGLLVACGGDSSTSATQTPSTPTPISLSGVVAKGAALAGATITAKCATGTGTATSNSDGSYTLNIADGALPCVLEAEGTGADAGLVLHSVAAGSTTANITPLTELLVAQLSGQDPATFMDSVSASSLSTAVTTTTVGTAQTAVLETLTAAGVDTSAITNVVSSPLVAAVDGTGGNSYDLVLDALADTLAAAGTTLTELTTTVASTAAGEAAGGTAPVPESSSPLPADLLLRAKASNCDSLRSTNYRLIKLTSSADATDTSAFTAMETMTIDAAALTATFGPDDVMSLTAAGDCRYTLPEGEAAVSPAGVMVVRHMVGADDDTVGTADRGANRMMIGLPIQQGHQVGDLAGTWNFIGMDRETTAIPSGGSLTISAGGVISGGRCFEDPLGTVEASCTVDTEPAPTLAAHADGGFTLSSSVAADPWVDRIFTFKAGNGEIMMLVINNFGEFVFGTRQRALPLPAVGDTSTNVTVQVGANLVAGTAIYSNSHTIASVTGSTVVRNSANDPSTVTHPQTLAYNSARTGYVQRSAATNVAASDGSNVPVVRLFHGLPLQGMGLTALYGPNTATAPSNNSFFAISVRR